MAQSFTIRILPSRSMISALISPTFSFIRTSYEVLMNEKVGEIKAEIIERDGKILMVKDCAIHGHFEDVMSIDTDFSRHLEEVFPGRDIRAHNDEKLHHHGSSTVKYGRGSVLTIDLTNRCNM